jgi:hypothetical protein
MGERRSQRSRRRVATWQISRLRGTPAVFIGLVDAPDAATAKERAIKQFAIRPEDRDRLIAVRQRLLVAQPVATPDGCARITKIDLGTINPDACRCSAAGMPCLACNQPKEGERPRMPADFIPHIDRDKGPVH